MGRPMGLGKLTNSGFKRKYRWMFKLEQVVGDSNDGPQYVNALPPTKAARPNLTFKEIEVNHVSETVYFPGKPDWKPVSVTLYDLCMSSKHPVWNWITSYYKPEIDKGNLKFALAQNQTQQLKRTASLELYDGCGDVIETWTYENCYPQMIEFGELDMGQSEVVTCELTLRYDRAYVT